MLDGMVNENGDTYYYNQDGSLYYGWRYESGKWYYLDGTNVDNPGSMATDTIVEVGARYYCFDKMVLCSQWVGYCAQKVGIMRMQMEVWCWDGNVLMAYGTI